MAELWADSVGFAGAVIVRRCVGVAHVADFESIAGRPAGRRLCRCAPRCALPSVPAAAAPCRSLLAHPAAPLSSPLAPAPADDDVRAVCEARALRFGRRLLTHGGECGSAEQLTEAAEAARHDGRQPFFAL